MTTLDEIRAIVAEVDAEISTHVPSMHLRDPRPCPTCGHTPPRDEDMQRRRSYGKEGHYALTVVLDQDPPEEVRVAIRTTMKRLFMVCLEQSEDEAEQLVQNRMGTT